MKSLAVFSVALAIPGLMLGAALNGTLSINGGPGQNVAVGVCTATPGPPNQCIDFDWTGTSTNGTGGNPSVVSTGAVDGIGDTAVFNITNGFVASNGGTANGGGTPPATQVTVGDLNNLNDPTQPGVSNYPGFITFNNGSFWTITLTNILAGVDGTGSCAAAPAAGQFCSPPGGPFNEQNSGVCAAGALTNCTANISFSFLGTAFNGLQSSAVAGIFSTTFSGTDYQNLNAAVLAGQDIVTSDSGTLNVTAIPEPMTFSLVGLGLLGLGFVSRKIRK